MYYEAGMVRMSNHSLVRDSSKPIRWSYRLKKESSEQVPLSLEEEILRLRKSMEQAVLENHSLTSDLVVEISRKLDDKINEFMRKPR